MQAGLIIAFVVLSGMAIYAWQRMLRVAEGKANPKLIAEGMAKSLQHTGNPRELATLYGAALSAGIAARLGVEEPRKFFTWMVKVNEPKLLATHFVQTIEHTAAKRELPDGWQKKLDEARRVRDRKED